MDNIFSQKLHKKQIVRSDKIITCTFASDKRVGHDSFRNKLVHFIILPSVTREIAKSGLRRFALLVVAIVLCTINTFYNCYASEESTYIKWIDFNIPLKVLNKALDYDIDSYNQEIPVDWIELLAYSAAKNWGNLKNIDKALSDIDAVVKRLQSGEKISEITSGMELYDFYIQSYGAVLRGFVGEYEIENTGGNGEILLEKKYGLRVFSPIAKGYGFSHYDDFGNSRSYGYKRKHQGNDLMGSVGTPIIAVEDGYVEAMGWNRYGGWRIGIRSFDKKRYYYYAHLQKDHPYHSALKVGDYVHAGDVIGYLGMTGYSTHENINNIKIPHLHFGMQIIFDEKQKDGTNQIWIDLYNIVALLNRNKMKVYKNSETKEFEPTIKVNSIVTD